MELLRAVSLDVAIGERVLLRGLDLCVRAGECWAVLGPNGSGKTTLLHTLAGLRPSQGGSIWLQGNPLGRLSRRQVAQRLGLLPQDSTDAFPTTVLETTLIGRHPHLGRWQSETAADIALARRALHEMELSGLEARASHTLSGGERRRLAVATLFTQAPHMLLLDEPTNHLDLNHQIAVLQQLRQRVDSQQHAVLMSLHDINLAARFCDHVVMVFGDGLWQAGTVAELFTAEVLSELYGYPVERCAGPDGRTAFLPR